jgi:hypothetical protein
MWHKVEIDDDKRQLFTLFEKCMHRRIELISSMHIFEFDKNRECKYNIVQEKIVTF